jgi:hypothetical protein
VAAEGQTRGRAAAAAAAAAAAGAGTAAARERQEPAAAQAQGSQRAATSAQEQAFRTQRNQLRQQVAQTQPAVGNRAQGQNRAQLAQADPQRQAQARQFGQNRQQRFAALQRDRRALQASRLSARDPAFRAARNDAQNYWQDRANEVRVNVENNFNNFNNFDDNWWGHCNWCNQPILVGDPWWWWRPVAWGALNAFLGAGWGEPIPYDYGSNVVYGPSQVYVNSDPVGTPAQYNQQVVQQANPPPIAEAPVNEADWRSLGVWALAPEEQGEAVMFFQLSVNRDGLINGAYANVLSGENAQVTGRVDMTTQRVAWHIGDQKDKVFEAGMSNLTQDQAPCLVHSGNGQTQNWLLVRMEGPNLPSQPAAIGEKTN